MVKILLIEDNEIFRKMFKQMLLSRFSNILIIEAGNCAEGFERLKKYQFNLIFTDIKLPDGNGLDCIDKIKTILPKKTIVVLSLSDLSEYHLAAKNAGADLYISKQSLHNPLVFKKLETLFLNLRNPLSVRFA